MEILLLLIKASKKDDVMLNGVFWICYLIQFKKNKIQTLITFSNKINAITLVFILKLGFMVY